MSMQKIDNLELHCGIDTFEVTSPTAKECPRKDFPYVRPTYIGTIENKDRRYIFNPDKAVDGYIEKFSEYKDVRDYMFNNFVLDEPYISRIDFRFDNLDDDYIAHEKLNRLLLALIAVNNRIRNIYDNTDFLTLAKKSNKIKCNAYEAEYYNKAIQEPNGFVSARLELRNKDLSFNDLNGIEQYYWSEWIDRIDNAVTSDNLHKTTDKINSAIMDKFNDWKARKPYNCVNAFIDKYDEHIYTRRQLRELFKMLGCNNPNQQTKNYMRKPDRIELFSLDDLKSYSAKIFDCGNDFFKT